MDLFTVLIFHFLLHGNPLVYSCMVVSGGGGVCMSQNCFAKIFCEITNAVKTTMSENLRRYAIRRAVT